MQGILPLGLETRLLLQTGWVLQGARNRQKPRRRLDFQHLKQFYVFLVHATGLPDFAVLGLVDADLQTVQNAAQVAPSLTRLVLGHPHQQQGQPAQQHVRPDPVAQPMLNRPDVEHVFQVAKRTLHPPQRLVAQNNILSRERVVR